MDVTSKSDIQRVRLEIQKADEKLDILVNKYEISFNLPRQLT